MERTHVCQYRIILLRGADLNGVVWSSGFRERRFGSQRSGRGSRVEGRGSRGLGRRQGSRRVYGPGSRVEGLGRRPRSQQNELGSRVQGIGCRCRLWGLGNGF
eukprot:1277004-Rhodomonas_salina.1